MTPSATSLLATLAAGVLTWGNLAAVQAQAPAPINARTVAGIEHPRLGVEIDDNSSSFDGQGLRVVTVFPTSTAAAAGVRTGDILVAINDHPMHSTKDLQAQLASMKAGDRISLSVLRQGQHVTLTTILHEPPSIGSLEQRAAMLENEVAELEQRVHLRTHEPTLAEVLADLDQIERNLPVAIARFKKQYPQGRFSIKVNIDIQSDAKALHPMELIPQGAGPRSPDTGKAAAPAPDTAPHQAGTTTAAPVPAPHPAPPTAP